MSRRWPWSVLGIARTGDSTAIRKAYSSRLKELDLDKQIAEYADLRNARDEALWLAKNQPDEGDDLGLGTLDDPPAGELEEEFEGVEDFDNQFDDDYIDIRQVDWPGAVPQFPQGGAITGLERPDGWDELAELLFPDGEPSVDGLTVTEAKAAEEALQRIVAWGESGDISRHNALDHNLADMLAGAWPRSAPLVERANEAYHWLGEAGGLDERRAIRFLNARTNGMRFHEAVLKTDHPLNKAWVELSRPGKVSLLGRLKIRHTQIDDLLKTIRANFPELESLLDAERVESWETPGSDIISRLVQIGFVLFLVLQAIRFCAGANDELPAVLPEPTEETGPSAEEVKAVLSGIFGEGFTAADLREADPIYAALITNRIEQETPAAEVQKMVRLQMRRAIDITSRDNAVALQGVYRDWLVAALGKGAEQCRAVQTGELPDRGWTDEPEKLGAEQALARRMLSDGDLSRSFVNMTRDRPKTFAIPGPVIERAMTLSGLPEQAFRDSFADPDAAGSCATSIAVLGVILEDPSAIEDDLLRGMW